MVEKRQRQHREPVWRLSGSWATWLYLSVMTLLVVGNGVGFFDLQEAGRVKVAGKLLRGIPTRAPEYVLRLRESTSLEELASMPGPFTQVAARVYQSRSRYSQLQAVLAGREVIAPLGARLDVYGWRTLALATLRFESAELTLGPEAGRVLRRRAQHGISLPGAQILFPFDPQGDPSERLHLLSDPKAASVLFVVPESKLAAVRRLTGRQVEAR
jgi:hypothetical protein